jgi:hypothetical protein
VSAVDKPSPSIAVPQERREACVGVVIGASRFPEMPAVDDERLELPFRRAAQEMTTYLRSFCSPVLDLFDSDETAATAVEKIRQLIHRNPEATDLVAYYVGHGAFTNRQEYFLCLRTTEVDATSNTGLLMTQLADALRDFAKVKRRRVHLVLDCCFAGAAMTAFLQAPSNQLRRLRLAGLRLPSGFALLCAASRDDAAVIPEGDAFPLFSGALFELIQRGIGDRDRMSLRDALAGVDEIILARGKDDSLRPELHLSNPKATNVADLEIFPLRRRDETLAPALSRRERTPLDRVYDMSAIRRRSLWRAAVRWVALPLASLATLWFVLASDVLATWREYYSCWHGGASEKGRACTNYANRLFWSKDYKGAKQYYHFGCEQRDGLGCAYLGMVYEEGRGVPADSGSAVALYKLSCETLREHQGCTRLGTCYARGACGLPHDEGKARALFDAACQAGETQGCDSLKDFHLDKLTP